MPTSESLPRRMRHILPENGYESPRSPDNRSQICFSTNEDGERRRTGFGAPSEDTSSASDRNGEAEDTPTQRDGQDGTEQMGDLEGARKKIGFRDRVGCYTWLA